MATPKTTIAAATQNLVTGLQRLANYGLTDAAIAAITVSGTVAKLKTLISGLAQTPRTKTYLIDIQYEIDRCVDYGTLTDADVEAARAAGTLAALITAIGAHVLSPAGLQTKASGDYFWGPR